MLETASQRLLLRLAKGGSKAVILIGAAVLIGWALDVRWLKSVVPGFVAMNPITAILFLAGGVGLHARLPKSTGPPAPALNRAAWTCAMVLIGVGGWKLVEYGLGLDFSFGQFLWERELGSEAALAENQLPPNTAMTFVLCGAGIYFLDPKTRWDFRPAQALFLGAGLVALLAIVGYACHVLAFYSVGTAGPMALNSAAAFAILSLSGMGARPDRGIMKVITSDSAAGAMARRLLPAAIVIPLAMAAFEFMGETDVGLSVFAVGSVILFSFLVWWNARLLLQADWERTQAERRLAVQYCATRVLADAPNPAEAAFNILKSICQTLNWPAGVFWRQDSQQQVLRCEQVASPARGPEKMLEEMRTQVFSKGQGLPGRVWETGTPEWVPDLENDVRFQAASEAGAPLRWAVAFPIRSNGEVCGVMEFFGSRVEELDEHFLRMLAAVGSQIGQFFERKKAEEQLRQASADLSRSNTELQQFAYVASHDLSEPLRMVVSYLELLSSHASGKLDAESLEFMGYAVDGAKRMQALIGDLLAYARVDSGGRAFQEVNCEAMFELAVMNLKLRIRETGAVIEHEPLPTVTADGLQLTQVFQNLISNAIKFRGAAAPRIHVSAKRANGDWLFAFKDNGIGLDPRHADRIFVLFQRLHTRQEYPGTGMGLAICKKVIERHGGRIWVESKPGEGATFFFTLPARR